ncbi:3-keto-5-aminohexanoate cleavage protein [[Phormidium] sp. LEGE 05292]|uniref:3-keto-5-aminohexanoate cleavage protein n=1 Tax=[Phormidium] sp. LEGE 05292 TaxID=767427 RepID=UPI001D14552E|nr:3-keto-5-aminohexanoate cleavage protein [Phormidium sp. LEGE 05292]
MYFTDDSLFPENMQPLIITAAPFGPEWLPGDVEDIPVSWDEQVQAAVDCYNAGATMLHVHVRDPKTGQGSTNFDQYNEFIGRLREAVPKMILQVGGSISFAPHTEDAKAKKLDVWYDTVEETLFNLGLPPNRPEGYKGFLTYESDAVLPKPAGIITSPTSIL